MNENWDWGRAIPFLGIHKFKFLCSVSCTDLYTAAIEMPLKSLANKFSLKHIDFWIYFYILYFNSSHLSANVKKTKPVLPWAERKEDFLFQVFFSWISFSCGPLSIQLGTFWICMKLAEIFAPCWLSPVSTTPLINLHYQILYCIFKNGPKKGIRGHEGNWFVKNSEAENLVSEFFKKKLAKGNTDDEENQRRLFWETYRSIFFLSL